MDKKAAAVSSLLIGMGLLIYPLQVGSAIKSALANCAGVIIPSLFPFMALCAFISLADLGRILTKPISPLLKYIYGLPPELGGLVLSGFVGGYPVAAASMSTMIDQGKMSPKAASRLLTMCTNASPTFVISIAGAAVLGSVQAGAILYCSQLISALITGYIFLHGQKWVREVSQGQGMPLASSLVKGVRDASSSMLFICGFYIAFTSLIAVANASGFMPMLNNLISHLTLSLITPDTVNAAITGLLEVTAGCLACSKLSPYAGIILIPFLLSFSSFSVFCQVAACLQGRNVSLKPFAYSRIIHGAITTLIAAPLIRFFTPVTQVFSPHIVASQPLHPETIIGSFCIIVMCSFIFLSFEEIKSKL